jgi:hypothetical protein
MGKPKIVADTAPKIAPKIEPEIEAEPELKIGNTLVPLTTKVMLVTPKLAKEWLAKRDEKQRQLKPKLVRRYIKEIVNKAWPLTHQAIGFNTNDRCIDGQHRLSAIVATGISLYMLVVWGVVGDYSLPIDIGGVRTNPDLLRETQRKCAVIANLTRLQLGTIRDFERIPPDPLRGTYAACAVDVDAVVDATNRGIIKAPVAGALAFARPLNPDLVDIFMGQVRTGEMLSNDSPAMALRNWLLAKTVGGVQSSKFAVMMATTSAVWAVLEGRQMSRVNIGTGPYEALCARRRSLGIPYTPAADDIPSIQPNKKRSGEPLVNKIIKLMTGRDEVSVQELKSTLELSGTNTVNATLGSMRHLGIVTRTRMGYWTLATSVNEEAENKATGAEVPNGGA